MGISTKFQGAERRRKLTAHKILKIECFKENIQEFQLADQYGLIQKQPRFIDLPSLLLDTPDPGRCTHIRVCIYLLEE